ncbi:MAG TPA: hypothetical protein PLY94_11895, partial [Gemmatimonadaceae bacterium]|nr:hypothetical protein [Gemmatimonadaceae bacterium]
MTPSAPTPVSTATPRQRAAGEAWLLGASVLTVAAAWWIRSPSAMLTLGSAAALLMLLARLWRGPRVAVGRRIAFTFAAAGFVAAASAYHVRHATLERDGASVRTAQGRRAAQALSDALRAEAQQLDELARAALDAPIQQAQAYAALAALVPPTDEARAVVLARNGQPTAWSGQLRLALDSLPAQRGLIATPFYLVAYAVQVRGPLTAVATSVIHAEPPADALVRALSARVAAASEASGFVYASPEAAAQVPDAALLAVDSLPLLAARAVMPSVEAMQGALWERTLPWTGAMLATMMLCLLAMAWRRDLGLRPRFLALLASLLVPTLLPLSVFSNVSTWFDPSFYLVRSGGRFTANAAALAR